MSSRTDSLLSLKARVCVENTVKTLVQSSSSKTQSRRSLLLTELGYLLLLAGLVIACSASANYLYPGLTHYEVAKENARKLVRWEQEHGLYAIEIKLQEKLLQPEYIPMVKFLNAFYMIAHGAVALVFRVMCVLSGAKLLPKIVRLQISAAESQRAWLRCLLMFVFGGIIQVTWPCVPPRELTEFAYQDPIMEYSATDVTATGRNAGVNPYASMPSLHMGMALLVAHGLYNTAPLHRPLRRMSRALAVMYPAMQGFTIVVTGNHYILDIVVACVVVSVVLILIPKAKEDRKVVSPQPARPRSISRPATWV